MEYAPNVNTKAPLDALHRQLPPTEVKPEPGIMTSPFVMHGAVQPTAVTKEELDDARILAEKLEEKTIEETPLDEGNSIPIKILEKKETVEVSPDALEELRSIYTAVYIEFIKSVREKRVKFRQIMSDLNADKHMPIPEESDKLTDARKEYLALINKKCGEMLLAKHGLEVVVAFEASEREDLLEAISEAFSPREVEIASKANGLWETLGWDEMVLSEQLASGKLDQFEKPVAQVFDGFRAPAIEPAVTPEVEEEEVKVSETVTKPKPGISQLVADFFGDVGKEKEIEVVEVSEEAKAEPVVETTVETSGAESTILEEDYKEKKMAVIRKGVDLKVLFGGIEIGVGNVVNGKASLNMNEKIKVPFYLLATPTQTLQQEAFKTAQQKLQSITLN